MEQHSWFSPTTYLAVACTAFSVLAVATAWRNQQTRTSQKSKHQPTARVSRPQLLPTQRVPVDCLYSESSGEASNIRQTYQSPAGLLSDLIQTSARLAQQLRSRSQLTDSRITVASMLGELSLLTTTLSRLQQALIANPSSLVSGTTQAACFDTTTSSLAESFALIASAFGHAQGPLYAIKDALQQLRDQRPSLEYLIETIRVSPLPPTPPTETDPESLLKPSFAEDISFMHPLTPSTGLTPAVDAKGWIEPPPEYSPPARGSLAACQPDAKYSEATPPHHQHDVGDEIYDHDALYNAVTENDTDLVAELLALSADPAAPTGELQRTALHQAAHLNHTSCLTILVRNGATMSTEDSKGDTPLHLAAWAGHVEALSALLAHGADVDWLSGRDGYSPLWCAVSAYHIDAARLLLRHGARVSLRSTSGGGLMPLHQAAVTGQSAMCELLLERGAQVDSADEDSNTPLHYAAASGSVTSVGILLRNGAAVTAAQRQGLTPAHWAAHKGHTEVLKMLLSYGAAVNAAAEAGAMPLHCAANRGHMPAVKLLLESGANVKVRADWDGVTGTAENMAKAKGHLRLVMILQSS